MEAGDRNRRRHACDRRDNGRRLLAGDSTADRAGLAARRGTAGSGAATAEQSRPHSFGASRSGR